MSDNPSIIPTDSKDFMRKLAEIMAGIRHVAKRGFNDFHKYNYATEADIADAVRDGLAAAGIMMIPSVEHVDVEQIQRKDKIDRLVRLLVRFTVTDGHDGIYFNVIGEGQDAGDKASYKAMTGATKYALLKLFLIPTGDDPEREDKPEEPPRNFNKVRELYKRASALKLCDNSEKFYMWAGQLLKHGMAVNMWTEDDLDKLDVELKSIEGI